eukprot:PRCOL_00006148-RA
MSSPRWAAVARLSDGVVLAQAAQPTPLDAGAQATVARVLASGQIKPDTQLTVTIGEEHGHLHLSAGASCVFLLLAPQDYPRRAALRLLAELSGWAAQIEEVKSTMANNIDQVMSNAESLRGVEDKSEAMLEDAATYRTRATA